MRQPPRTNRKRAVSPKVTGLKQKSKPSQYKIDTILKKQKERHEYVRKVIKKIVANKDQENSFYIFDLKSIKERVEIWRQYLPRVELCYATKANADDEIVKECARLGCGFDVASENEMRQVLGHGVNADDLIFANPVKQKSQLDASKNLGVKKMTFDCIEELEKIHKWFPKAECVLRIAVDSTTAFYNLSEKFGAPMEDVPAILDTAQKLKMHIKGVAFHTGSGGVTFTSYEQSLKNVRKIFEMAKKRGMKEMDFLDIGGGFTMIYPGTGKNFDEVAPLISKCLDKIFPEKHIRIIAEPGRFVCESACYLACAIIGQKNVKGNRHYYLNNGIFQGYSLRVHGEEQFLGPVNQEIEKRKKHNSVFWGQTCDSADWVIKDQMHPEYKSGEWIVSKNFGAYNRDLECRFNGFEMPNVFYEY